MSKLVLTLSLVAAKIFCLSGEALPPRSAAAMMHLIVGDQHSSSFGGLVQR